MKKDIIRLNQRIHVTVWPHMFELMKREAEKNKITVSQYIREALMEKLMTDNEEEFIKESDIKYKL